jgi:hypothetical protein
MFTKTNYRWGTRKTKKEKEKRRFTTTSQSIFRRPETQLADARGEEIKKL